MELTEIMRRYESRVDAQDRIAEELEEMFAHVNAATAKCLELALELDREGGAPDGLVQWFAFRCGITSREAGEYVRVAEALEDLPAIKAAFGRGELTFAKVRALTRVANPQSERGLLELASVLTASQLSRALRVYRRVTVEEARDTHDFEYVDYHWDEDGSLVLRARLAAEDGMLVVRALDAARERVYERRREERAAACEAGMCEEEPALQLAPRRPANLEALVDVARRALECRRRRRRPRGRRSWCTSTQRRSRTLGRDVPSSEMAL
jgi:hypothetical protein